MKNPFNFFDHIYFIVSTIKERQNNCIEQLEKIECSPGKVTLKNAIMDEIPGRGLNESFKQCLESARLMDYEKILICEDDVYFHDDYKEQLSLAIKDLPAQWEHLKLSANIFGPTEPVGKSLYRISSAYCLHAAAWHRRAYDVAINLIGDNTQYEQYVSAFDRKVSEVIHKRGQSYVMRKKICGQRNFISLLEGDHGIDVDDIIAQSHINNLK